MRSLMAMLAIIASVSISASAQTVPDITLTRLDCGTSSAPSDVSIRFSDTYAYSGLKIQIVFSCYLIKHGDDYMMWDAGHSMSDATRELGSGGRTRGNARERTREGLSRNGP